MTKKIDPQIYMPPVEGYEYKEDTSSRQFDSSGIEETDVPITREEGLFPPQDVRIVEQIFRRDAAGKTVVDLIVEVEDMPGATEYEIRTSVA